MRQKNKQLNNKIKSYVQTKSTLTLVLKIIGFMVGAIIIFSIIQYELVYRAFVFMFLIGFAYVVNKKLTQLKELISNNIKEAQPELEIDTPAVDQETQIFEKVLIEKEEQLEKIDLDRTQLLEELFSKADLNDLEKQSYREKIKQKESERTHTMEDLLVVKGRLHQAILGTKKYFVKEDPMKEVAAAIDKEHVQGTSIATLNEEIHTIIPMLTEEVVLSLKKNNYIDEDHNLTRSGYKSLMKMVDKE